MRSWSTSEGIMLVPSTFTGWYRKIMMNAEIAREMTRSRSQTPKPELKRTGGAIGTGTGAATASDGVTIAVSPAEPGSVEFPTMQPYCIQNQSTRRELYWRLLTFTLSRRSLRVPQRPLRLSLNRSQRRAFAREGAENPAEL